MSWFWAESDAVVGGVKHHLGTSYNRPTINGKMVHLSLMPNPSHLEVRSCSREAVTAQLSVASSMLSRYAWNSTFAGSGMFVVWWCEVPSGNQLIPVFHLSTRAAPLQAVKTVVLAKCAACRLIPRQCLISPLSSPQAVNTLVLGRRAACCHLKI